MFPRNNYEISNRAYDKDIESALKTIVIIALLSFAIFISVIFFSHNHPFYCSKNNHSEILQLYNISTV